PFQPSRAAYYDGLIRHIGDAAWYEPQVRAALADLDEEMDLDHLCDWALLLAQRGDDESRRLLYACCAEAAAADSTLGAYQVMELDGLDGFLFAAKRLGAGEDPGDDYLLDGLEERLPQPALADALAEARRSSPQLAAYLDGVARHRAARERRHARSQAQIDLPYAELKALLAGPEPPNSFVLTRWGARAEQDDFAAAARDLVAAYDKPAVMAGLAMFMRKPFPLDPALLFPLAWDEDADVAGRTLWALRKIEEQHPGLRRLSFDLLEAGRQVDGAVRLFAGHFQDGDIPVLADALARASTIDELHDLELGLRDVFDEHPTAAAAPLLIDLIERGPCPLCRSGIVDYLLEDGLLPPALRDECRFDAYDAIREAVAE
ncbi:MAG TPA: hypothetical protein VGE07_30960, partial [Herpetosiphonaceae bacterium]